MIVRTMKVFKQAVEVMCFILIMLLIALLIVRFSNPIIIIKPMIEVCNAI